MKRPITEGRLRDQANRCENAKCERCRCRCGGALHGTHHSDTWVAEEVFRDKVRFQHRPEQTDWVGYAGFEKYLC